MVSSLPDVAPALNSPQLLRRVNELRRTDNLTNWFYLAREYLFLAAVIGGSVAFYHYLETLDASSWWWAVPVTLAAIVLVGAGQHRLVTLTHEAAHYMLFRNRLLNEFVSEWFCMFPVLSTTHHYRVQHLGHHQYPNDPDRDPDSVQLRASGHRFRFPMTRWQFLWQCVLKQFLWLPNPIRYILVRAAFKADGDEDSPYRQQTKVSPILVVGSAVYLIALVVILAACVQAEDSQLLLLLPTGMLVAMLLFYASIPDRWYTTYLIKSDIAPRWAACLRVLFMTLTLTAVAWLTFWTGRPWWLYYLVLWVAPLGTSFAFFMILRQLVQHGNAPRDRLTNTRIFHVAWPIRCAVFPIGNDYHLPHHLFPMVPHYNLRKLHALLMDTDAYRKQATLVEGYFFPPEHPAQHPTVLDLMTR